MNLRRIAPSLVGLGLIVGLGATQLAGRSAAAAPDAGTTEANITRVATGLLERSQFAHHPLDTQLAGTLLDRYLDALDGARSLLLQWDVDEFASYRTTLAEATRGKGDLHAAQAIFHRYLERSEQRASYVDEALRTAAFDFTGHDVYSFDRSHAPRPRDATEARGIWRQQLRAEYLQEKLADKPADQIARTLKGRYAQQLRTLKGLEPHEVLDIYLNALAHVYDPHSDYLGHEQMDDLSIAMRLSLVGIGATLEANDGYCTIRDLVPGGPAAQSGLLKPGDRIVAVAQAGKEPVDVVNMPLSRMVDMIRGPAGTTVTLQIVPSGAPDSAPRRSASIVRQQVQLADQEAKARIVDLPTGEGRTRRIGVIDLPSFYSNSGDADGASRRSATADVARLLEKLKGEHVQGLVLDVRRNGGGSLDEAITLTGLFIRQAPVVQTRDLAGDVKVETDPDPSVAYDGPLVVLTSRFSASATEILAGALQDYGRAVVVGDSSTFGKGTVQNVLPLARIMDHMGLAHSYDPGALKVTIRKFYRPSGASTQLRGVASDIVLPSTSDLREVSESALEDPLPWDSVPPAQYEHLNRVAPYLARLKGQSAQRVVAAKDFAYIASDVDRIRHRLATKSVSMNEAERRDELAGEKIQQNARERDRQAHPAAEPVMYEITLANASVPGLPAPLAAKPAPQAVSASAPSASSLRDIEEPARKRGEDVVLREGERILIDYTDLLSRPSDTRPR